MNFLSHYYFDKKQDEAYFNLGLILPDIVRNFVRGTKLNYNLSIPESEEEQQLLKGCIQHVQSDKIYHSWKGFHDGMDFITQRIRNSETDINKDWFIAHILTELTMDHYLVNKHPNLASNLYTDFEKVETQILLSFLGKHDFHKFDQFSLGFDRFMKFRYLESYTESHNIVFALGKICNKMGLSPFSEGQKALLKQIVTELAAKMPQSVVELDAELK